MKHTNFAIDLRASDKGERKKAVEYLRSKGYKVIKRKDEIDAAEMRHNYLFHHGCEDRFEYIDAIFTMIPLTLPRDWKKFVEYVSPEDVTEKKREPKVGDWVVVEAAVYDIDLIGKTLPITKVSENRIFVGHRPISWNWEKPGLRFATPEKIAVVENPAPKLETGMLVEFRDGDMGLVVNDIIIAPDDGIYELTDYRNDLTCITFKPCDIVKVSSVLYGSRLSISNWTFEPLNANLLWERK